MNGKILFFVGLLSIYSIMMIHTAMDVQKNKKLDFDLLGDYLYKKAFCDADHLPKDKFLISVFEGVDWEDSRCQFLSREEKRNGYLKPESFYCAKVSVLNSDSNTFSEIHLDQCIKSIDLNKVTTNLTIADDLDWILVFTVYIPCQFLLLLCAAFVYPSKIISYFR